MDEKGWRSVSIVLGIACALLLGVSAALLFFGRPGASSTPSPGGSSAAVTSPSATGSGGAPPSPTPARTSGKPSASTGPSASHSPTPTPLPTPNSPTAEVRFSNMMLDASADPKATRRTFTFASEGPGPVSAQVVTTSPQGQTKLCMSVDGSSESCVIAAKPAFASAFADTDHSVWTITAIGTDISTPTIDIVFRWPAKTPQIQLTHGRFQGQGAPDSQNGFSATLKTRGQGTLGVQGSWTTLQVDASLIVADITSSPAIAAGETQFQNAKSIDPPYALAVDAQHTYKVELRNLSADQYRPDLTASISFP